MDKTELTGAQERRYPGMRAEMVGKMCSIKPNTGARKDRVQLEGQTNLTRACLREKSKTKHGREGSSQLWRHLNAKLRKSSHPTDQFVTRKQTISNDPVSL